MASEGDQGEATPETFESSNDSMLYENPDHQTEFLLMMKSMYNSGELVDVTIVVLNESFHCHRNVLAATSPYFRAMFTSSLNESKQTEIHLHEIDPASVRSVIEYSYTGAIEITKRNAQNLLAAASLFQINPILKACAKYMESQLDIQNCVCIHYFAQIHNCEDLKNKAREHIEKNFLDVMHGDEFLTLSADKVAEIFSSNELNVEKEESVFEALLIWLKHDEDERQKELGILLPLVRFGLINLKFYKLHYSYPTCHYFCTTATSYLVLKIEILIKNLNLC